MKPRRFWTVPCWLNQVKIPQPDPGAGELRWAADAMCGKCLAHDFCPLIKDWRVRRVWADALDYAVEVEVREVEPKRKEPRHE